MFISAINSGHLNKKKLLAIVTRDVGKAFQIILMNSQGWANATYAFLHVLSSCLQSDHNVLDMQLGLWQLEN